MKKIFYFIAVAIVVLLSVLIFNTHMIKFPVNIAEKLVNMKVEIEYNPIESEKSYATIRSCGRNCSFIKVFHGNAAENLVITATNYVSWADDPKWSEETLVTGTDYYYQQIDNVQHLFLEKDGLELELEYSGKQMPVEEFVKIADSVEIKINK